MLVAAAVVLGHQVRLEVLVLVVVALVEGVLCLGVEVQH
jgi:hypothetical protein